MSSSPRSEALRLMQSGRTIAAPEMRDNLVPNSPEALAYIDSFKEEHFVILAQVMDRVLGHALANRRPDDRSSQPVRGIPKNQWQAVADLWRADLDEAREAVSSTDLYKTANQFAQTTGQLNTARHISLDTKMMGGIGTGVINTFTMLRNVPQIIRHHLQPEETASPATVARHPRSIELIRRTAKLSINQAMAAQAALAGDNQPSSWADFDKVLDPQHFRLHRYPNGTTSLGYADFGALEVPAGYKPHDPFLPVEKATLATDIPSQQNKTVGCPITLLQKRLGELWLWGVDLVEANKLWEEDWPA